MLCRTYHICDYMMLYMHHICMYCACAYMVCCSIGSASSFSWPSSSYATATTVNGGLGIGTTQARVRSMHPPGNNNHSHNNNSNNNNNNRNEEKVQSIHALQAARSVRGQKMAAPVLLSSIPDATLTGVMQHRLFGGLIPWSAVDEQPPNESSLPSLPSKSGDPPPSSIHSD